MRSAILSALIRSPYSRVSTAAAAARTRTRPVRRPCQQWRHHRRRNQQRLQLLHLPLTTAAKFASCSIMRGVRASIDAGNGNVVGKIGSRPLLFIISETATFCHYWNRRQALSRCKVDGPEIAIFWQTAANVRHKRSTVINILILPPNFSKWGFLAWADTFCFVICIINQSSQPLQGNAPFTRWSWLDELARPANILIDWCLLYCVNGV